MGKAKKAASTVANGSSTTAAASASASSSQVSWPLLASGKRRRLGEAAILVPDQIVEWEGFLTPSECAAVVGLFDSPKSPHPMLPSPPARKGEAQRTNSRFSSTDPVFADILYRQTGLADAVVSWPSIYGPTRDGKTLRPAGLNSNIRVYRYDASQLFAPHYDDHAQDPTPERKGWRSEWTVLIYLTGHQDGVKGGETVFYRDHSAKGQGVAATLSKGKVLLHRHGKVCMLHEAQPVKEGVKWVLRSDLMFAPDG